MTRERTLGKGRERERESSRGLDDVSVAPLKAHTYSPRRGVVSSLMPWHEPSDLEIDGSDASQSHLLCSQQPALTEKNASPRSRFPGGVSHAFWRSRFPGGVSHAFWTGIEMRSENVRGIEIGFSLFRLDSFGTTQPGNRELIFPLTTRYYYQRTALL